MVKDGNLRIGAEIKNCTGNYVCIDNVRLSYQVIYEDVKDYLEQLVAEADKLNQHDGSAEGAEMEAARKALQTLMDAAQSEGMDAAVKRLQSAMTTYRMHLTSPDNPMDMTEFVLNPSFESGNDGWQFSGMGTQGNSDFRKVGNTYAETWSEWGSSVHDAKLWQKLTALPNGRYKLTAVAQNIQQNNTSAKQKGCYIFANDSRTEVNVYGKYEVEFVCVSGEATIGFQTEGATGNYCCVDDFHLYFLGFDEEAEQAAFSELIRQAEEVVVQDMNTSVKETLQTAIADAKAVSGSVGRDAASRTLTVAIEAARTSNALYVQLDAIIAKGEQALAEGKSNGQERLQTAVNSAKGLRASGDIDADKVATADYMVEDGIFAYNVLNGSGTAPKVTTGEVIVGCNAMVGRLTASGSNIIERGFCWAENPNPTVLDEHSSNNQNNDETNWSPVYVMYNVKASTEYWVRAYAITKTYAVGYGEPVRVITLPQGETVYKFLWNGDDEHNEWLDNAMREATAYYNTWTAIKGFRPTANYSPGTETADCSYGGWINVGPWRCNTGTMVHEMMHGTGVGQHGRYWSQELHPDIWWLGERANRVCHFFENYDSSRGNYNCNGDGIHICYEGNGNDMQQIRSCILMQALYEDGLPALTDGMIRTLNSGVFTATQQIPVKMPKGVYGLLARGYQRPGSLSAVMKDYKNGKNNVKTSLTLNTRTLPLKHIAQGGSDTRLDQGGSESAYSGIYVPTNNATIEAYLSAGRYDNLLKAEQTTTRVMTVGLKKTQAVDNDLLVLDGFQLFYYGDPEKTGIEEVNTEVLAREVEGYYNLNGTRITKPVRGIIIVKFKDGHSEKIKY